MDERTVNEQVKRTQKNYSLAFKLQVIDEIEKGNLTYIQAQRKYGIQGKSTVLVWLRKHGRFNWQNGGNLVNKTAPNKKIKELERKIKTLELEKEILNKAIDIADEKYDTHIRKKFLAQSSMIIKNQEDEN